MKNRLVFALILLLPIGAYSKGADKSTIHLEFPVSQEVPAPACLGLPDGATISEDFLHIIDTTFIEVAGGFHQIDVIESNGTATANDGAWFWDILAHSTRAFYGDGDFKPLVFSVVLNRLFVSKQVGVPNLHRTVNFQLVRNAVGEFVVINGSFEDADFVCTP